MRELEFLPDWYPRARRKRRFAVLQVWILVTLFAGFSAWLFMARRGVGAQERTLESLKQQLDQTYADQRLLAEQLKLRQELQTREQLVASIGFPVEMTRLLQTLDQLMPKEMSLVELKCDTDEQIRVTGNVTAIRGGSGGAEKQIDRKLKIKMLGVSPSDVDLANFLMGLTKYPFFEHVAVSYARDKIEAGHVMREFEVTFTMPLNQPALQPSQTATKTAGVN
jgi:Tfp pilus assembly protein PilN